MACKREASKITAKLLKFGQALLYNRPHLSLDGMTPDQAYFTPLPVRLAA
jgi:hypothetical protein